jgi:coenzyme F420-reducing hydrogenase beta subunit
MNKKKITFHDQSSEKYNFYIGNVVSVYAGYSKDEEIRSAASSGGIVSAILIHLLETKKIDGALVSKIVPRNGKLSSETIIATSREEILSHAGSSYVDIPITTGLKKIEEFYGKVAVVSVPCYISALDKMCRKSAELNSKIAYKIGLFCGGNVKFSLYEMVLRQHNISEGDVLGIFSQRSHIKGNMIVTLKSGEEIKIPFHHFNVYRILGYHCKPHCIQCDDHTSESADISVGDIFFREYKKRKVKHSSVICRTGSGERVFREMIEKNKVFAEELDIVWFFQAVKKALMFRKNLTSRRLAGRILGIKIKEQKTMRVRWNYFVASFLILLNIRLQKNRVIARMMYRIPKPFLYIEVLLFKFLTKL